MELVEEYKTVADREIVFEVINADRMKSSLQSGPSLRVPHTYFGPTDCERLWRALRISELFVFSLALRFVSCLRHDCFLWNEGHRKNG